MSEEEKDHIDEMVEWQEHQFDPGYYTGGRIPPSVKANGNPTLVAIFLFVQSGIVAFVYFCTILPYVGSWSTLSNFIIASTAFAILFLLTIFFAIRYLQRAKKKKFLESQYKNEDDLIESDTYDNRIKQRVCPECGREHDIDYPKCPYCKHSYTI